MNVFLHSHLENMKRFKLDVPALVSQHVHHELEVFGLADVFRHHSEVMSVQEKFAEELKTVRGGNTRACLQQHMQVCKPTQCGWNMKPNKRDVDLKRRAVNLQRLPFGDIVFRMQELLVLGENLFANERKYIKLSRSCFFFLDSPDIYVNQTHPVIVFLQKVCTHYFVPCQQILQNAG